MLEATVYRWDGHAFVEFTPAEAEYATVKAAETWQVDDGYTLGWIMHMQRFSAQLASLWQPPLNLWEFYGAVVAKVPSTGKWYPRLECSVFRGDRMELILRLRVSPNARDEVRLLTAHSDDRTAPLVKGPDLAYQMQLRRRAQMAGADESVFISETGMVLGCTLSNLVWWQDEELYTVPAHPRKFPGITEQIVTTVASATGITVNTAWVSPHELAGREVWSLSSTFGIRVVTSWEHAGEQIEFLNTSKHRLWSRRLATLNSSMRT